MTSPREPRAGRFDHLEVLADQGRDIAVVMAATELPNVGMTGVELLTSVRARHPQARRLLLVERGQWRGHAVREAMVLGQVDSYVFVPWALREQWLYLPVTEALADGSKSRPTRDSRAERRRPRQRSTLP